MGARENRIAELMRGRDAKGAQGGAGGLSFSRAMEQAIREEERARVVGYLRNDGTGPGADPRMMCDELADAIESGEHLKGGG